MHRYAQYVHDGQIRDLLQTPTLEACMASLDSERSQTMIVVVPTVLHQRIALTAWARAHGGGSPPLVMTMNVLLRHLAGAVLDERPMLCSDADAGVLLREAAIRVGLPPGAFGVTISRIVEWTLEGWSPDRLYEYDDELAPRRLRRLRQLADLWSSYRTLKGTGLADRADLILRVTDGVACADEVILRLRDSAEPIRTLLVTGLHDVTYVERILLHILAQRGWNVGIRWLPDDVSASRAVSDHTTWLVGHGWQVGTVGSEERMPIDIVERMSPTRRDEARLIAAFVKRRLMEGDVKPSRICVAVASRSDAERHVLNALRDAGVPVSREGTRRLSTVGSVTAVLAALDVMRYRWRRSDVERLLRSGYVTEIGHYGHALLNAAEEIKLQGGEGALDWSRRLQQRRIIVRDMQRREGDDHWYERKRMLDDALMAVAHLQERLPQFEDSISAADFVAIVRNDIAEGLGIGQAARERQRRADVLDIAAVDEAGITTLMETCDRYVRLADVVSMKPAPIDHHVSELVRMVLDIDVRVPDSYVRGVDVLPPQAMCERRWNIVVVPAMTEGEFPVRIPDGVDEDLVPGRAAARQLDALQDVMDAVDVDGLLLLTRPHVIDDAPTMPSTFIARIGDVTGRRFDRRDVAGDAILDAGDTTGFIMNIDEARMRDSVSDADDHIRQQAIVGPHADPAVTERIATITHRPLSPSRLDTVAACPYQYYARHLLGIDVASQQDDSLSGLERGNLLHDVARRFYESYRTDEGPIDITAIPEASLYDRLVDVYHAVAPQFDMGHTYIDVERRAMLGTADRAGILRRWLALELSIQRASARRPAYFEHEVDDAIDIVGPDGTLRNEAVSMRVDRIDIGTGEEGVGIVVTDYKTTKSSTASRRDVISGVKTQMPLYLAAVTANMKKNGIPAVAACARYVTFGRSMRATEDPVERIVINDPVIGEPMADRSRHRDEAAMLSAEEQVSSLLNVIGGHVDRMRAASYPVDPVDGACRMCSFNELCRIDHWGRVSQTVIT